MRRRASLNTQKPDGEPEDDADRDQSAARVSDHVRVAKKSASSMGARGCRRHYNSSLPIKYPAVNAIPTKAVSAIATKRKTLRRGPRWTTGLRAGRASRSRAPAPPARCARASASRGLSATSTWAKCTARALRKFPRWKALDGSTSSSRRGSGPIPASSRSTPSTSLSSSTEATIEPIVGQQRRDVPHGLGRVRAVPDLVAAPVEPAGKLHVAGLDRPAEEGARRGSGQRLVARPARRRRAPRRSAARAPPTRARRGRPWRRAGRRRASPRRSPPASSRAPPCARARRWSAPARASGGRWSRRGGRRGPPRPPPPRRRPRRTRAGPPRSGSRTASPRGHRPAA